MTHLQPIAARFRSRVELTIHDGFLTTAGALQCDPVAKVHLVTVKKLWKSAAEVSAAPVSARRGRDGSPSAGVKRGVKSSVTAAIASASAPGATTCTAGSSHTSDGSPQTSSGGGGVGVTISAKTVASTEPRYFTARPRFEQTLVFDVDDNCSLTSLASKAPSPFAPNVHSTSGSGNDGHSESVEDFVVITVEDATEGSERFLGEAYCPFSPHCPSTALPTSPVRVMLQPRNVQDQADPLFQKDMQTLRRHKLDDFGFLTVSWRVRMLPHGGAIIKVPDATHTDTAPAFPLGLTIKARWQAPPSLASQPDTHFTASVDFGNGGDRFVLARGAAPETSRSTAGVGADGEGPLDSVTYQPLFLTIRSASQLLNAVTFHCSVQSIANGSHEVAADLLLPLLSTKHALDRDIHWSAPVRTERGTDVGLLFVTLRLSRRPLEGNAPPCADPNCPHINDPLHQEEATHVVKDWTTAAPVAGGTAAPPPPPPLPDAPLSAYQPLLWESPEHIAKAAERAWKRGVVLDAQPTPEHVRHVFDVLMGRVQLDAGVARVAAAFFNRPPAEISAMDLKEFMIACAFNGRGLSVVEAARFCFVALRRDVEDAVAAEEVVYMFLHALLGKTVDMSEGEVKRWVNDILGDATAVSFTDFTNYILRNEAIWSAFGVPVFADAAFSSAQHRHHYVARDPFSGATARAATNTSPHPAVSGHATRPSTGSPAAAAAAGAAKHDDDTSVWRTFAIRVPQSGKAFRVTAHVNDTVGDVKKMVEASTAIAAARQDWRLNGEAPIDSKTVIGSTVLGLPSAMKPSSAASAATNKAAAGSPGQNEVWIKEAEETVTLQFVHKTKHKRWTEKVPVAERVLKVRASVQRHTLIPLSRCVLKVVNPATGRAEVALADRHPISHYHLQSGDVVEVSQE